MLAQTGLAESRLHTLDIRSMYARTIISQVYIDLIQPAQSEPAQSEPIFTWFGAQRVRLGVHLHRSYIRFASVFTRFGGPGSNVFICLHPSTSVYIPLIWVLTVRTGSPLQTSSTIEYCIYR